MEIAPSALRCARLSMEVVCATVLIRPELSAHVQRPVQYRLRKGGGGQNAHVAFQTRVKPVCVCPAWHCPSSRPMKICHLLVRQGTLGTGAGLSPRPYVASPSVPVGARLSRETPVAMGVRFEVAPRQMQDMTVAGAAQGGIDT